MTNLKKYTLSDLQEKKIAVFLKSDEEYLMLKGEVNCFLGEGYYLIDSYPNSYRVIPLMNDEGYTKLDSIDEIDLGDEGKEEIKPITCKYCGVLLREGVKEEDCPNNPNRSTTVIATDADCVERIQQLESQIARLKGEKEKLIEEKRILISQLKESYGIDRQSPDLTKRDRMAWELYIRNNMSFESAFKMVDTFLAKSKEVGNG